ncbi:RodZ domain-containing protein [Paenibacillus alvei]|uniref:DUF4115 domain-containing protein n=1 Tax=Paenibacillus alvei TaxID=44250 RepID=A0AAP7DHU4_PAEAL|nr:DUF4115 domain-containing protein [Paenibacillus alvei]
MSELGQLLKKARLEKNLSLDDVQEATKIRKRYLEAIEEGDYKVLPGSFYVRAFVKTYAETVGLNPDEILQYYRNDIPTPEPEPSVEPLLRTKKRSVQSSSSDRFGRWASTLLLWAFIILIGVIVYFFVVMKVNPGTSDNTSDDTNITETQTPSTGANGAANGDKTGQNNAGGAVQQPVKPTTPEPPKQEQKPIVVLQTSKRSEDVYQISAPANTPVKVEIKAVNDRSWLAVHEKNSSGKKLHYETLEKDQTVSFDMTDQGMFIRAGYAKAIEVTVAGEPLNKSDNEGSKNIRLQWISYEEAQKLQAEKQGGSPTTNTDQGNH